MLFRSADDDASKEVGVVEGGDLKLQRLLHISDRGRDMTQDRVKQRTHVVAVGLHVGLGEASETAAEQVGEIALIIVSAWAAYPWGEAVQAPGASVQGRVHLWQKLQGTQPERDAPWLVPVTPAEEQGLQPLLVD